MENELENSEDISLLGELDSEEESPYLRRQKTVAVRRRRFARRWRWLLADVALLALSVIVGYVVTSLALTSPAFRLRSPRDVEVVGSHFVSREEVLNALSLPLGERHGSGINIFRISLETRRKLVESKTGT